MRQEGQTAASHCLTVQRLLVVLQVLLLPIPIAAYKERLNPKRIGSSRQSVSNQEQHSIACVHVYLIFALLYANTGDGARSQTGTDAYYDRLFPTETPQVAVDLMQQQ
eukprot:16168-Heterococcus_DN1.PRE.2